MNKLLAELEKLNKRISVRDDKWVTIKKGEEGKGRKLLLDDNGNIIGGDVPKASQGKSLKEAFAELQRKTSPKSYTSIADISAELFSSGKGKEASMLLDDNGALLGKVVGDIGEVDTSQDPRLKEPGQNLEGHHSHPYDSPPSLGDVLMLANNPGMSSVFAHTPKKVYQVKALSDDRDALYRATKTAYGEARAAVLDLYLQNEDLGTPMSKQDVQKETANKALAALAKQGLISYSQVASHVADVGISEGSVKHLSVIVSADKEIRDKVASSGHLWPADFYISNNDVVSMYKENGVTDPAETFEQVRNLFKRHGLGGNTQLLADSEIMQEIEKGTNLGKALITNALYETHMTDLYDELLGKVRLSKAQEELSSGYISSIDENTPYFKEALKLYRKGEMDKDVLSFTTNPDGANMGSYQLTPTTEITWKEAKKQGYLVLGGISRMMGASGESEVTLIKIPHSSSVHDEKWITTNPKDGKGKHILLNDDGTVKGGAVPKSAQGKTLREAFEDLKKTSSSYNISVRPEKKKAIFNVVFPRAGNTGSQIAAIKDFNQAEIKKALLFCAEHSYYDQRTPEEEKQFIADYGDLPAPFSYAPLHQLASLLDAKTAKTVFSEHDKFLASKESAVADSDVMHRKEIVWNDALEALAQFGCSQKIREEAYERRFPNTPQLSKVSGAGVMFLPDSSPASQKELVRNWLNRGGGVDNVWFSSAVASVFQNQHSSEVYWTGDSVGARGGMNGVVIQDIPAALKEAVQAIYDETQEYFKNNPKEIPKVLYRGVAAEVTTSSPAESWTAQKVTAKKFDGHSVLEQKQIDPKNILMSWKSTSSWLPEESLKGKQEFVLIGGSF